MIGALIWVMSAGTKTLTRCVTFVLLFCAVMAVQCLVTRGLLPLLAEGSARATDTDTTDEILAAAIEHAKRARYCAKGDCIVALHRIGNASVIKIVDIK
jgi:hypothetical protein